MEINGSSISSPRFISALEGLRGSLGIKEGVDSELHPGSLRRELLMAPRRWLHPGATGRKSAKGGDNLIYIDAEIQLEIL